MGYLAVIPARGGSKRIPRKNVKDFNGKPLISYAIKAALGSGIFDRVVVSTDDEDIAAIAKEYGAEVPFLRDKKLADDYTGTFDVMADAYERLKATGQKFDGVCCIYATAPLLLPKHLVMALEKLKSSKAQSLTSVCEFSFPIQRAFVLDEDGLLKYREPEFAPCRSQDLPKCYQDCGLFYFYTDDFMTGKNKTSALAFPMPRHRVIDIDTMEDWDYACAMSKAVSELNLE